MGDQTSIFNTVYVRFQRESNDVCFESFHNCPRLGSRTCIGLFKLYILTGLVFPLLLKDRDQFLVGFPRGRVSGKRQFYCVLANTRVGIRCCLSTARAAHCKEGQEQKRNNQLSIQMGKHILTFLLTSKDLKFVEISLASSPRTMGADNEQRAISCIFHHVLDDLGERYASIAVRQRRTKDHKVVFSFLNFLDNFGGRISHSYFALGGHPEPFETMLATGYEALYMLAPILRGLDTIDDR